MMDLRLHYRRLIGSELFKATRVYGVGHVIKKAIPFLLLPVMTAFLTPEDYAALSIYNLLVTLITMLCAAGILGSISLEYLNKSEEEFQRYVSTCLVTLVLASGFVAGACFVLSDALLSVFKIPPEWLWTVFVIALGANLVNLVSIILQASHKPARFMAILIGLTVIEITCSLYLVVVLKMHWEGRVIGIMVSGVMMALPLIYYLWRNGMFFTGFNKAYATSALAFGLPLIPHYIGTVMITMSDRLLLDHMVDRQQLGLYAVAFQLASVIYIAVQTLHLAWTPWFYERLKKQDADTNRRLVNLSYLYFLLMPIGSLIYGVSTWLLFEYFVNDAFAGGYPAAIVLSLSFAFMGMGLLLSNYLTYARKTHLLSWITIVVGAVNVGVSYLLIGHMGMMGAAWGTVIAHGLSFVLTWLCVARIHPMPWLAKRQQSV